MSVKAEVHSDDWRAEAKFDATAWLAQASDKDIIDLAKCDWGGDYPADAVAQFMDGRDDDVTGVFAYLSHGPTMPYTGDTVGFECYVNENDAMRWLAKHRPSLHSQLDD